MKTIKNKFKIATIIPFVTIADIAFLLLIFLILTSSIEQQQNTKVNLPKAAVTYKTHEQKYNEIFITKDNNILYKNRYISFEKLRNEIVPNKKYIITADKDSSFLQVFKIIHLLTSKNCRKILFTVDKTVNTN